MTRGVFDHSELTQVVVVNDRGHLQAVVGELVAQSRRSRPLRAQDQLGKQSYACAVASRKLGASADAFADALRVRFVAEALRVSQRALKLRVRRARRLVQHAQCFVNSTSEADNRRLASEPGPSLAAPRRPRRAHPPLPAPR